MMNMMNIVNEGFTKLKILFDKSKENCHHDSQFFIFINIFRYSNILDNLTVYSICPSKLTLNVIQPSKPRKLPQNLQKSLPPHSRASRVHS